MTITNKRGHGEGAITQRGQDRWRIRWRVGGKRYTATVQGSMADARRTLRAKLKAGDDGAHVAPDRITLSQWATQWLDLLARNDGQIAGERRAKRGRGLVNRRTWERYEEVMRLHILPALGTRPLQKITATEIDALYVKLEQTLSARSVNQVHTNLKACLSAAVRKGLLMVNPASNADAPSPGQSDAATVLEREQLTALMMGFRKSTLYPIVATAAYTGARRNEILALRWSDFDATNKTLTIARSLEETRLGNRFKEPKTEKGVRTITLDDGLVSLLKAHREKHQRIAAGVPDCADVDLSLVKLSADALIFPSAWHGAIDLTKPRDGRALSDLFRAKAKDLGFPIRFHDLRATHETLLLDDGVPVHTVAARCGHDPAVLLRSYARRTKKGDTSAAAAIGKLSKGVLW
jgi:integrase